MGRERSPAVTERSAGSRYLEEAVPPAFAREDILAARFGATRVLPFQQSIPPFVSNLALAIFSGLLLTFAFPDWELWSLGWVGTAPLVMAVARERRFWRSVAYGTVCGSVFYLATSHWVTYSMHNYGGLPLWLSYAITAVLLAPSLGVFTGLFAGTLALALKRFRGWALLSAPVIWPACEWLRLEVTGMGWNALGYSQAFQPAVIQISRFGGVYVVSSLLVAASTALVFALIYLERRRGFLILSAFGAAAIACVTYGLLVRPPVRQGDIPVLVVQPNLPIDAPWENRQYLETALERVIALSDESIEKNPGLSMASDSSGSAPGDPLKLVIWPESPMPLAYDRDQSLRDLLGEFASRHGVHLLTNTWGFSSSGDIHNSAVVIGPEGTPRGRYDKTALMPFGEYVPARGWIPFMDRIPALAGDVTAATEYRVIDAAGVRIGINICFETITPVVSRRLTQNGADVLVQISNESWFGPSSMPRQMLSHAVFRAVENNIELVRATNSGVSARIDRYGGVHNPTPSFETATRVWRIADSESSGLYQPTFYSRRGDVFAVTCVVLASLLAIASLLPLGHRGLDQ